MRGKILSRLSATGPPSFKSDVLKLVSGTGLAQLVGILAAPVLTRLYAPADFGIATLFASLTLIVGVVACLRYELSIVLPDDDREAANLLAVSLMFAACTAVVMVPIIIVFTPAIVESIGAPAIAPYLWLLPIAIFAHGVYASLNYWSIRSKRFSRMSIAQIGNQLIVTSTNLGAGFAGIGTGGTMIMAGVAGRIGATAVLGSRICTDDRATLFRNIRWQEMLRGIRRHRKFPMFSSGSALLNALSWQLPALMLGAFFSPAVVGFYALGFRILQMPMNLIGSAISQVFVQRAAEARADGTLAGLVENLFRRLVLVGLFPMLMLTVIGRDLYAFVFGATWAEAGTYTQILSIWAFFWFISSPLSQLFVVLERQEFTLGFDIALLTTRVLSLGIGSYLQDVYLALLLFSMSGVLVYGFLSFKTMQFAGVTFRASLGIIARAFLVYVPMGATLIAVKQVTESRGILLSVAALGAGIFAVYAIRSLSRPAIAAHAEEDS